MESVLGELVLYQDIFKYIIRLLPWRERPQCRLVCFQWMTALDTICDPRWWEIEWAAPIIWYRSLNSLQWVEAHTKIINEISTCFVFTSSYRLTFASSVPEATAKLKWAINLPTNWSRMQRKMFHISACSLLNLELMVQTEPAFGPNDSTENEMDLTFAKSIFLNQCDDCSAEALEWMIERKFIHTSSLLEYNIDRIPVNVWKTIITNKPLVYKRYWWSFMRKFELAKWIWSQKTFEEKLRGMRPLVLNFDSEEHAIWMWENVVPLWPMREQMIRTGDEITYNIFAPCPISYKMSLYFARKITCEMGAVPKLMELLNPGLKEVSEQRPIKLHKLESSYVCEYILSRFDTTINYYEITRRGLLEFYHQNGFPKMSVNDIIDSIRGYKRKAMVTSWLLTKDLTEQQCVTLIQRLGNFVNSQLYVIQKHPQLVNLVDRATLSRIVAECSTKISKFVWSIIPAPRKPEIAKLLQNRFSEIDLNDAEKWLWFYEIFPELRSAILQHLQNKKRLNATMRYWMKYVPKPE